MMPGTILISKNALTHALARANELVQALRSAKDRSWLPGRRSRKHQLNSSFAEVETMVAGLAEVSAALEERFLETVTDLMELDKHGSMFVTSTARLVNAATGRSGGSEVFFSALAVMEGPLAFLNESHEQMKVLLDRLNHDSACIASLINGRDDLQRTMAPLKYIQTSFRIEAAPLGEEVQLMFSSLTQEIEKLHTQVCELFSTKYEELRTIQQTIAEVIGRLKEQTDEVWKNTAREQQMIDATLKQLQRELQDNQKRESSISNLSGDLAREIQQVVTGLQFQDIINQRLQHTAKALNQVREQLDGSEVGTEFLEQACRLEGGQVAAVRQDLAGAEKSVKQGIKSVLACIVEADERCVSLREFETLTTSANGMVQVLLDVVATLQKQISVTVAGCSAAYEILRPIGSMASDLTEVVHDLSQRIHLIGLNAQVQAAQVAEGMGLEVLSARTSEISRETNRISETMASQLDRLVSGLAESLRALESLHTSAGAHKAGLDTKGADCEKQLHGLRDAALAALVDVHDLLNGIRAQSERVLATANYLETADGALADLQAKLGAAADLARRHLGNRPGSGDLRVAAFKKNYTMASELQVFENLVDQPAKASAGNVPAGAAGPEAELFGNDSVETPGAAGLPKPANTSGATDHGVELF